jgi:hypothetical protein
LPTATALGISKIKRAFQADVSKYNSPEMVLKLRPVSLTGGNGQNIFMTPDDGGCSGANRTSAFCANLSGALLWSAREKGLRLSTHFQADAAAGSQLESDFEHLDPAKLVKQLPRGQGGGADLEFTFKTHPQTLSQECDNE